MGANDLVRPFALRCARSAFKALDPVSALDFQLGPPAEGFRHLAERCTDPALRGEFDFLRDCCQTLGLTRREITGGAN